MLFTEIPTEKMLQMQGWVDKIFCWLVGWLVGAKSGSEGPVPTYDVCGTLGYTCRTAGVDTVTVPVSTDSWI